MPLGPVFRHEMYAAGRKARYFWVRVLVGIGMLALLGAGYQTVYQQLEYQRYAETGEFGAVNFSISGMARLAATFYAMFAWATMLGVLAITPAVAAGAIAMERERRTIEYLFATDLSNSEIVLDKLLARLLTVGKIVLATLPVLAIFRLLGGVSGGLLLMHFGMLASTATLAAAIALTVGVWCERARDAVPRAVGAVFLWLVALPLAFLIEQVLRMYGVWWAEWLSDYVVWPAIAVMSAVHPLLVLATSAGVGGSVLGVDVDSWVVGRMIGLQLLIAAGFLAVSVAMVRRVHLRAASAASPQRKPEAGSVASRSPFDRRPVLWKEMFAASVAKRGGKWANRVGVTLLVLAVGGPLVSMLVASVRYGTWFNFDDYMQIAAIMTCTCGSILLLLAGTRAAGLVTYEHERDTWMSLLSSPLDAEDVIAGKTWGNLYAFRWPFLGVLLIPLTGAVLDPIALLSTVGVAAALACCGWGATAIGLAISLRMKNSIKAVGATVVVLLTISALYPALAATLLALSGVSDDAMTFFFLPPVVPFLLAMPTIGVFNSPPDYILAEYFAGLCLYGLIGFVTTMGSIARFDELCGRGVGAWGPPTATATVRSTGGALPPTSSEGA